MKPDKSLMAMCNKQGGAILILALMFLWLMSLLLLESTQINRIYYQVAQNFKQSKQSEMFADETCHHAHQVLKHLFRNDHADELSIPVKSQVYLSPEDLYRRRVDGATRVDSNKWPLLMSVQRDQMLGSARYSLSSIDIVHQGGAHQHYADYGASGTATELLTIVFELRCEGRLIDVQGDSVWIHRDYKLMMLRSV